MVLKASVDQLSDDVLYHMHLIFSGLATTSYGAYSPRAFWNKFKLWGEPIHPGVQQDAYEFYSDLISQLDECLEVTVFDKFDVILKTVSFTRMN